MSEFVLSSLVLSRLTSDPEAHRLLFLLTWPMRVHYARIFSDEAIDGESGEVMKTFIMDYTPPAVKSDLLTLD